MKGEWGPRENSTERVGGLPQDTGSLDAMGSYETTLSEYIVKSSLGMLFGEQIEAGQGWKE